MSEKQFREVLDKAEKALGDVEPTKEEKRNGWTKATLTAYLAEQAASREVRIDPMNRKKRPPMRADNKYNPLRWRR